MSRSLALITLFLLLVLGLWFRHVGQGGLGAHEEPGTVTQATRPADIVTSRSQDVASAADELLISRPKQILFGDLHVHTTYSFDAFMMSLPLQGGEGAHPPADACDFARFCSALDFWSINDHAESISPAHWAETVDSVRACNAVAGQETEPDTVAFLGWEWTQVGQTPENHFGHKNIVLRDLEDGQIPARPIGAGMTRTQMVSANPFGGMASGAFLHAMGDERLHDLATFFTERGNLDVCPLGVPVRDLPVDCVEMVDTPDGLFAKLDDWDVESIVIPHGTTWGFYTPPGSDWAKQLEGPLHDDDRQTLFEVYSGHGNSEEYSDFASVVFDAAGAVSCPTPTDNYLPTCWRAGEIIRERCLAVGEEEEICKDRAVVARQNAAEAGGQAHLTVPGVKASDWLDAGQCRDCALPAFNYRPLGSAQYVTALGNFGEADATADGEPRRFRFGFMGSSDNHFGRPGTGFKEVNRTGYTESRGEPIDRESPLVSVLLPPGEAPRPESRSFNRETSELSGFALFEMERQSSFFQTGGLIAAHAEDRGRGAIWDAMQRREVYGTSGPRMLLWFDLINAPDMRGRPLPMGGETAMNEGPIFQARAAGSFEQKPGCPEYAANALGADRLAHVCKNECYNPGAERRAITRIEIVRIRPQNAPGEPIAPLIEDPWRTFHCDGDPAGCSVTFDDPDYARFGRDTVYYARAIEATAPGINVGGVQCERDAKGNCTGVNLCGANGSSDDCLSEHEPQAWSSPIFVDWKGLAEQPMALNTRPTASP